MASAASRQARSRKMNNVDAGDSRIRPARAWATSSSRTAWSSVARLRRSKRSSQDSNSSASAFQRRSVGSSAAESRRASPRAWARPSACWRSTVKRALASRWPSITSSSSETSSRTLSSRWMAGDRSGTPPSDGSGTAPPTAVTPSKRASSALILSKSAKRRPVRPVGPGPLDALRGSNWSST